jgi:hypothetical protein
MAYKGMIYVGTTAKVTLSPSKTNSGPTSILAGVGWRGGEFSEAAILAPGASGTLELKCDKEGLLRIEVDFSEESDAGKLEVERGTLKRQTKTITGDVVWRYSVVEPEQADGGSE